MVGEYESLEAAMRRVLPLIVVLSLLPALAFAQGTQQTHTGRAEPGFVYRYSFTPTAPGQLLATLSWDSSAAHLLMIAVCTVEGEEIPYGIASGLLDRFARLEAGLLPNVPCEIGIMTGTSSANYMLNLQRSQPEPSTAQARETVSIGPMRTVIPGTSRGAVIERIAFRLERAVRP
jgi:hypothetical protein